MKRQVYSTIMRGDVYKTIFTNKGILMYFSIPLSTKFGTTDVENYCNLFITGFCYSPDYVYGINRVELFNREVSFRKTPYKNVDKRIYTQKFVFLKVVVFTPYDMVYSLTQVYRDSKSMINEFIEECLTSMIYKD